MGATDEILELYVQAVKNTPEDTPAVALLAKACLQLEKSEQALKLAEYAAHNNPRNTEILKLLARALEASDRAEDAADIYQRVVSLNPADEEGYLKIASLYQKEGRSKDALHSLNTLLQKNPESSAALFQKALCYISLKDTASVKGAYATLNSLGHKDLGSKVAELYPAVAEEEQPAEELVAAAPAPDRSESPREAIARYKQELKNSPYNAEIYSKMGYALRELKHHKEASQAFALALKFNPNDFNAAYERGVSCVVLGDTETAARLAAQLKQVGQTEFASKLEASLGAPVEEPGVAVQAEPAQPEPAPAEAAKAEPQPEPDEVDTAVAEAPPVPAEPKPEPPAEMPPPPPEGAGTLDELKERLRTSPFDSSIYLQMGRVYLAEENYSDALTALNLAIRFQPKLYEAYYEKAMCLLRKDKNEDAKTIYTYLVDKKAGEWAAKLGDVLGVKTNGAQKAQPQPPDIPHENATAAEPAPPPEAPAAQPPMEVPEPSKEPLSKDSLADLEAAKEDIKNNPYDAQAYFRLGLAYENSGSYHDALTGYNLALQFSPDLLVAKYRKGLCHVAAGDIELAENTYTSLDSQGHADLAKQLREAIDAKNAEPAESVDDENAEENAEQKPAEPKKPKYGNLDDPEDVIATCKEVIKHDPYDPEAYHNMGLAYKKLGKFEDAIGSFGFAVKANSEFHQSEYEKGVCFLKMGQEDKALQTYTSLLKSGQKELAKQLFDQFLTRLK